MGVAKLGNSGHWREVLAERFRVFEMPNELSETFVGGSFFCVSSLVADVLEGIHNIDQLGTYKNRSYCECLDLLMNVIHSVSIECAENRVLLSADPFIDSLIKKEKTEEWANRFWVTTIGEISCWRPLKEIQLMTVEELREFFNYSTTALGVFWLLGPSATENDIRRANLIVVDITDKDFLVWVREDSLCGDILRSCNSHREGRALVARDGQ